MKRFCRIVVLLLCTLFFCGFLGEPLAEIEDNEVAAALGPILSGTVERLRFAVPDHAPEMLLSAAVQWGQRVENFSGESLAVSVESRRYPEVSLLRGEADVVFLDNPALYSDTLALFGEPMIFRNHTHFTIAANSATVLRLLEEDLRESRGAVPLGAYYRESRHLLSSFPLQELGALDSFLGDAEPRIVLMPDSQLIQPLQNTGALIEIQEDLELRYEAAYDYYSFITEFTTEELNQIDWTGSDLYYYSTMHNLETYWLLISASVYDRLNELQLAAVTEATAYLPPAIDDVRLLRITISRARMREMGVVTGSSYEPLRSLVFPQLPREDAFAAHLYNWIDSSYRTTG